MAIFYNSVIHSLKVCVTSSQCDRAITAICFQFLHSRFIVSVSEHQYPSYTSKETVQNYFGS